MAEAGPELVLESLLLLLRGRGLDLSPTDCLDARRVLSMPGEWTVDTLRLRLRLLFCRSDADGLLFDQAFEEWGGQATGRRVGPRPPAPAVARGSKPPEPPRKERPWLPAIAVLLALLAVLSVRYVLQPLDPPSSSGADEGSPQIAPAPETGPDDGSLEEPGELDEPGSEDSGELDPAPEAAEVAAPVAEEDAGDGQRRDVRQGPVRVFPNAPPALVLEIPPPAPPIRDGLALALTIASGVSALALLPLLLLARFGARRVRRRTLPGRGPFAFRPRYDDTRRRVSLGAQAIEDLAQTLIEHAGRPPSRRLDVPATVEATTRDSGLVSLRWMRGPRDPSFCLLVGGDRRTRPFRPLFEQAAAGLREAGVRVEVLPFDGRPEVLRRDGQPVRLEALIAEEPDGIWILGPSDLAFDPRRAELADWAEPLGEAKSVLWLDVLPDDPHAAGRALLGSLAHTTVLPALTSSLVDFVSGAVSLGRRPGPAGLPASPSTSRWADLISSLPERTQDSVAWLFDSVFPEAPERARHTELGLLDARIARPPSKLPVLDRARLGRALRALFDGQEPPAGSVAHARWGLAAAGALARLQPDTAAEYLEDIPTDNPGQARIVRASRDSLKAWSALPGSAPLRRQAGRLRRPDRLPGAWSVSLFLAAGLLLWSSWSAGRAWMDAQVLPDQNGYAIPLAPGGLQAWGGGRLSAVTEDGILRTFQLPSLAELAAFVVAPPGPSALALSDDGQVLAVGLTREGEGHAVGDVVLLDALTGTLLHRAYPLDRAVTAMAFAPGARLLAVAGPDGTIDLFDAVVGVWTELSPGSRPIQALSWGPEGRSLYWGELGRIVRWDVEPNHVKMVTRHGLEVGSIVPGPRGEQFASTGHLNPLRLWDSNGRESWAAKRDFTGPHPLAWHPGGERLALGTPNGLVRIVSAGTGAVERLLVAPELHARGSLSPSQKDLLRVAGVSWIDSSEGGALLALQRGNGDIEVWDPDAGEVLRRVAGLGGHLPQDTGRGRIHAPSQAGVLVVDSPLTAGGWGASRSVLRVLPLLDWAAVAEATPTSSGATRLSRLLRPPAEARSSRRLLGAISGEVSSGWGLPGPVRAGEPEGAGPSPSGSAHVVTVRHGEAGLVASHAVVGLDGELLSPVACDVELGSPEDGPALWRRATSTFGFWRQALVMPIRLRLGPDPLPAGLAERSVLQAALRDALGSEPVVQPISGDLAAPGCPSTGPGIAPSEPLSAQLEAIGPAFGACFPPDEAPEDLAVTLGTSRVLAVSSDMELSDLERRCVNAAASLIAAPPGGAGSSGRLELGARGAGSSPGDREAGARWLEAVRRIGETDGPVEQALAGEGGADPLWRWQDAGEAGVAPGDAALVRFREPDGSVREGLEIVTAAGDRVLRRLPARGVEAVSTDSVVVLAVRPGAPVGRELGASSLAFVPSPDPPASPVLRARRKRAPRSWSTRDVPWLETDVLWLSTDPDFGRENKIPMASLENGEELSQAIEGCMLMTAGWTHPPESGRAVHTVLTLALDPDGLVVSVPALFGGGSESEDETYLACMQSSLIGRRLRTDEADGPPRFLNLKARVRWQSRLLNVRTTPPDALVLIDGRPQQLGGAMVFAGRPVELAVSREGYLPSTEVFMVESGQGFVSHSVELARDASQRGEGE